MGNCNFSPKFLPLVKAKFEEYQSHPEEFKAFLDENFNPESAESVYQMFYTQMPTPTGIVEVADEQDFDTEIDEDSAEIEEYHTKQTFVATTSDSVDELFMGRAQEKEEMLQNFRREILGCSRLEIDWNNPKAPIRSVDANAKAGKTTVLNDNILKYKVRLLNTILTEIGRDRVEYDENLTDERLAEIINDALHTNVELSANAYNAYVVLSKFDDLLKAEAPYIKVKREYVDGENTIEGIDKYEYMGATVQHFTGWTMSEFADSMDQASLLAKTVLECIPEIVNDVPVKGSSIGLSGFYSCMSAMRDCLMYHPTDEMIEIREELKKGDKANMYKVIDSYIKFLKGFEEKSMDQYYKTHVSYLLGKLEGIREYLFRSDAVESGEFIDDNLKSIFKQMFYKNVQMSYTGYARDAASGEVEGKDLKGSFINTQTYGALDNMAASIYKFRTIHKAWDPIVAKWGIKKIAHGTFELKNGTTLSPTTNISNMDDSTLIRLFQELTGIILPSDFVEVYKQVQGNTYRDSLLKAIHVVINAVEHNVDTENNFPSSLRQDHFKTLAPIGKVLSIVFGSNTANVVKNITRKNNLPLFGLNSLAYNFPYIMWQHMDNTNPDNIYGNSYLFEKIGEKKTRDGKSKKYFEQQCLVMEPSVRSEVFYNGQLKSVDALTFTEVMKLAFMSDFYQKVMDETSESVSLQNATFADKGTHFLINYRLDTKLLANGMSLREMIKASMNGNSNPMIDLMYSTRSRRFHKLKQNIVSDYNAVFNKNFQSLVEISAFLKANPNINVAKAFAEADVNYYEEIHFSPKGGGFSETLLQTEIDLATRDAFRNRIEREKRMFIKDLIKSGFRLNKHLDESVKGLSDKFDKSWTDSNGNIIFAKHNGKAIELNRHNAEEILSLDGVVLHPALEAYYMSDVMLSNEYNDVMIGGEYCHPGKDESSRLIAQIKRSVIFGATQHSFVQNLPNGVSEEIKVAVMPDMPGSVRNIIGEEDNGFKSMDGAGLCTALQARLESNSLLDARAGYDKKTIGHDIDARYGRPTLLKWAVYAMTNARRRVSYRSVASQEELTKQCYSAEPVTVSLQWLTDALALQDVYFYDIENSNAHYKIVRFEQDSTGNIIRVVAKCDTSGEIIGEEISQNLGTLNTLYAVDQAFGGAWCMSNVNGKLKYSETNVDALEKFVTDHQSAKNAQVAYLVNKSAIKVGAGNINDRSAWQGKSTLRTISMKTRYLGVQMDAEHHLDESEVTEMTQMISALSQAGYTSKLVNAIYEDIGRVVDESLAEYKTAEQAGDEEIYKILGKAFVESFEQNDRDTIGLAQAFVLKAAKALKEGGKSDYRIPFSADTVSGLFISTVSSAISKKGIRRKYDGFAGVLSPSFNQIQYYRVGGTPCLFEEFAKQVHKRGIVGDGIRSAVDIAMNDIIINGQLNPFIVPIKQNEIDFEDTIIVQNPDGTFREPIYVKSRAEYSQLKHNSYPGCRFYNFTSKPKNLKDVDTKFEVNRDIFSVQDLDSVKASFFLQERPEIITTKGDPTKTAIVAKQKDGIDTLSHPDINGMHFGNPFTHFDYDGVVKPATAKDSVIAYEQWLRGTAYQDIEPERKEWIVRQIQDGSLKGKSLVYYTDRIPDNSYGVEKYDPEVAPSHAHILQKLIYEAEDDIINSVLGGQRINVQSDEAVVENDSVILPQFTRSSLTKEQKANIIRKKIQEDLRNLSKGRAVMMNGVLVQASNVRVIPAEGISGRYHAKEFGLGVNDTVDKVKKQGPKFFERKLRVKYRLPENLPNFCESVIYTPEGAKFMVRTMTTKECDEFLANDPNVIIDKAFENKDGVYYKGTRRVTNTDGVTFCTYNDNGVLRKLIILDKKKRSISSLMHSTFFDTFRVIGKDADQKRASVDAFNDWVTVRAKRMFDSFEEQLQTIGTRIPTQAMPSFMPMQIIAYTDSEVNDLYVPISLLQRQGADLKSMLRSLNSVNCGKFLIAFSTAHCSNMSGSR